VPFVRLRVVHIAGRLSTGNAYLTSSAGRRRRLLGLAWQIDSLEWHLSPADYALTLERRSAMMAEGIVVLHTLPSKLARRDEALQELRRMYEHAARTPRPHVVAS
jgi:hypothetical protein